jgi:murein DD-endopeptidase MepM/ murein hydrolase activator NlpD
VQRGQTVATVGSTGKSSAPHLHYEVLKDGKQIDPMRYIVN